MENIGQWHLDKRIPVALILGIMAQTVVIGAWVGSIQSRVTAIESRQDDNMDAIRALVTNRVGTAERLATLEEGAKSSRELLERIDKKLDKFVDTYGARQR